MRDPFLLKRSIFLSLVVVAGITLVSVFGTLVMAEVQSGEFLFFEDGNVYSSSDVSVPTIVSGNVEGMLDYNVVTADKYLYRVAYLEGDNHDSGTLVLADSAGNTTIVSEDIMTAAFSPDGMQIVVWNEDNEIHLMTANGKDIGRIGIHGALPVFSHDGTYVAYNKLADKGDDFYDLSKDSPYGIALYNLKTDEEEVVTDNVDDFQPLGFSADMSKFYFNSGRSYDTSPNGFSNHVASLWMVDMKTKNTIRLTNTDEKIVRNGIKVPIISTMALWSSDRKTVISSLDADSGIWKFTFNNEGGLTGAKHIGPGISPRWIVPDESIAVRIKVDDKSEWKIINIK